MAERPRRRPGNQRSKAPYNVRKNRTNSDRVSDPLKQEPLKEPYTSIGCQERRDEIREALFVPNFLELRVDESGPSWDVDSVGAESPDYLQEDYSKDPDYAELESEETQASDEDYAEDSDVEASEIESGRTADDGEWQDGEGIRARPPQRSARQPSALHAFNNGVGAELVPWLKKNFRLSYNPAAIMPRSQLYNKYQRFCTKNNMTVVNSACLGKVLRRTFPGVDTRRLGRRGESKYHYIGLEINPKKDQDDSTETAGVGETGDATPVAPPADVERARPKRQTYPLSLPRAPPRSALLRAMWQIDPADRENLFMNVFGKLTRASGAGHCAFVPNYLKCPEEWSNRLPMLDSAIDLDLSAQREQVQTFVTAFRIHLGIVAHCIVSGAFLTLPEVFRNFWISRNESLQVPKTLAIDKGFSDVLALYGLVGSERFQQFVAEGYLNLYTLLTEHFTPNFEATVGSAFIQIMYEFIGRYPFWLVQSVSGLNVGMVDVVYSCAVAFCVMLRKRIALQSSFSLVQSLGTDPAKAEFILKIFQHIIPVWSRGMTKDFNQEEANAARSMVAGTYQIFTRPIDTLTRWRAWLDDEIQSQQSQQPDGLRTILYISVIVCKSLSSLAQTDSCLAEAIPTADPFLWLLDFFQRYITLKIEEELVKRQQKSAIEIIFQSAMEERKRAPNQLMPTTPVALTTLTSGVGDWFRTGMPETSAFFAGSLDLEPFVTMLDDREVPERAPSFGPSVKDGGVAPVARKELSLLELLLR